MKKPVFSVLLTFCAQGVQAQVESPCGANHSDWLTTHAEEMAVTWTDTPISALMAGRPMPIGGPEPVQLNAIPDGFLVLGQDRDLTYDIVLTEKPLSVLPESGQATLAHLDGERIPECPIEDLPVLIANYTYQLDGSVAQGTVSTVVVTTHEMYTWFLLDTEFGQIRQLSHMTRPE